MRENEVDDEHGACRAYLPDGQTNRLAVGGISCRWAKAADGHAAFHFKVLQSVC